MQIFLSAGEPSGDLHGANLLGELRKIHSEVECVGFGCERLAAAGQTQLYPMRELAVMGVLPVLAKLPTFLDLITRADRYLAKHKPDAMVLIDYPGFNWWMARRAHAHGVPVFYFVPPQVWAWMQYRVAKMRRFVDHVMCNLPFEKPWYEARGVNAHYLGHPYFDELSRQQLDTAFLDAQRRVKETLIGLLPGSRTGEVEKNFPMMVRAAEIIHQQRPETRFLVAAFKEHHRQRINDLTLGRGLPIETFVGRTPEIIAASKLCIAVSGSVGLELLWHTKPAAVVYRLNPVMYRVVRKLITVPYISLVNLMAEKELYPEFPTYKCEGPAIAEKVLAWLREPAALEGMERELVELKRRMAQTGACERMAEFLLSTLGQERCTVVTQAA